MQHLQPNTTLQSGKYKIEKVLGQGGFGITYLAEQTMLGRQVAIKEFFMKELCERDESTSHVTFGTEGSRKTIGRFREKFLKEARNIARLNHPNIIGIIDIFEENGTAYYVMEYAANGSLADKVKLNGYLSEPVATNYMLQVADALDYIHQKKINHLDIKPGNIMLNERNEAVLIDFGLSKQYDAQTGCQTSTTPVGISEGYAPMEQYKQGGVGEFSPESDIYALGATFFKLLTGITPPSASDVNEDGVPVNELKSKAVSQNVIDLICKAMESRKKDRLKSATDFIYCLKTSHSTTSDFHNTEKTEVIMQSGTKSEDETTIFQQPEKKLNKERETFTVNGVSFDMIRVEGGTFMMGALPDDEDASDGEKPANSVMLSSFSIGETQVTQALWQAVMGSNPSHFTGNNQRPVECVSWNDCQEFIRKLNSLTGKNFRLPTEAEWEFAARGGNKSKGYKYSGSNNIGDVAWYGDNSSSTTHPVGQKQTNELGIYDMSGNVWEWCSDWYGCYSSSPKTNPQGPSSGSYRVIRGGSWNYVAWICRYSNRNGNGPECKYYYLGLRLALSE